MKNYLVLKDDIVLFDEVKLANDFFSRLVGLLKTKSLDENQGLLLKHCQQVHTFGMKFPIDVVFLSSEGEILYIEENMEPGKISPHVKKAYWVLELKAFILKKNKLELHQRLEFRNANNELSS